MLSLEVAGRPALGRLPQRGTIFDFRLIDL
jgi:hypothetical protein